MVAFPRLSDRSDFGKRNNFQITFVIALLLLTVILTGCNSMRLYENPDKAIALNYPNNWNVQFVSRSNTEVLWTKPGLWNKGSARIQISPSKCKPETPIISGFENSIDETNFDIYLLKNLYAAKPITIIQEPIIVPSEEYEIVKAIVSIPISSMQDDENWIQIDGTNIEKFQSVEIYNISSEYDYSITAWVFTGDNAEINKQAEEIIYSIKLNCFNE